MRRAGTGVLAWRIFLSSILGAVGASCALTGMGGCSSAGIALKESLGYEKREQLVDRVEDARDGQEAAKEQFASALEEFLALTNQQGGDLEKTYSRLKREFERSEARAQTVRKRIDDVERVADALFKEWGRELDQYSSDDLRRASQRALDTTRNQYQSVLAAMRRAERKMDPVLAAFQDQVLFLKHNLNARAIAGLGGIAADLESEIGALIADMNASIAEANAFIDAMAQDDPGA